MSEDKVPFGFEEVSRDEKSRRVKGVFASVAGKYDLMNDLCRPGNVKANMIAWRTLSPARC
jgi:demethylmenaquinone methyltransferase/2-methoxy-6-polyprenyl-1,4-benzoquinol methylase